MDEAKRALEAARKEETVVQSALKVLLNKRMQMPISFLPLPFL